MEKTIYMVRQIVRPLTVIYAKKGDLNLNAVNSCISSSFQHCPNVSNIDVTFFHAGVAGKENKLANQTTEHGVISNCIGSKPTSSAAIEKAEKIRLAIEKIKEASIKKIFIKVH